MLNREQLEAKFEEIFGMKSSPDGAAGRFITAILEAQQPSLVGRRARHKQPCMFWTRCAWSEFKPIVEVREDGAVTWGDDLFYEVNRLEFEDEPQSRFKVGDPVVFTGHKSVCTVKQVRGEWVSFQDETDPFASFYHQDSLTLFCDHSFKCEKCGVAK